LFALPLLILAPLLLLVLVLVLVLVLLLLMLLMLLLFVLLPLPLPLPLLVCCLGFLPPLVHRILLSLVQCILLYVGVVGLPLR
jgi:hypothetical protein